MLFQGHPQDGNPHPVVLFYFLKNNAVFRVFLSESLKNPNAFDEKLLKKRVKHWSFLMDPRRKAPFPACSDRQKPARNPHQTNLILSASDGTPRALLSAVSRLVGLCTEKGPLIAGFLMFSSHFSIIDPFDGFPWFRGQKGVKRCHSGVKRVSFRGQKQSMLTISGPEDPIGPGQWVPGSIQHLPWMPYDRLWLPGSIGRRYRNRGAASLLRTLPARKESGPLSPGPCSTPRCSHRVAV